MIYWCYFEMVFYINFRNKMFKCLVEICVFVYVFVEEEVIMYFFYSKLEIFFMIYLIMCMY